MIGRVVTIGNVRLRDAGTEADFSVSVRFSQKRRCANKKTHHE